MNIVLLASDAKKNLMKSFCVAYEGILAKHELFSTETSGLLIEKVCKLKVHKTLAGLLGGENQLTAMISANTIDMVIFLRNPDDVESYSRHQDMMRACDSNLIPLATNLASAELLLRSLEAGDLNWRNLK